MASYVAFCMTAIFLARTEPTDDDFAAAILLFAFMYWRYKTYINSNKQKPQSDRLTTDVTHQQRFVNSVGG